MPHPAPPSKNKATFSIKQWSTILRNELHKKKSKYWKMPLISVSFSLICYLAAPWLIWALVRGQTHSQQILKSFPCYLHLWKTLVPLRVSHPLNFWNVAYKVIFIFSPFFCSRVYYPSNKGIYPEMEIFWLCLTLLFTRLPIRRCILLQ